MLIKGLYHILNDNFNAPERNKKWAIDITYISTGRGFVYMVAVMDLYDNYIVDYIIGRVQTASLATDTMMENFFGTLKTECLYRTILRNFDEAEEIVDKYVDFYNYRRLKLKTSMTPYEKRC